MTDKLTEEQKLLIKGAVAFNIMNQVQTLRSFLDITKEKVEEMMNELEKELKIFEEGYQIEMEEDVLEPQQDSLISNIFCIIEDDDPEFFGCVKIEEIKKIITEGFK